MDLKQILKNTNYILAHYGASNQIPKAVEEMGELATALIKYCSPMNQDSPFVNRDEAVINEIADCLIMLLQLAQLFGFNNVRNQIEYKLERQNKRILSEISPNITI